MCLAKKIVIYCFPSKYDWSNQYQRRYFLHLSGTHIVASDPSIPNELHHQIPVLGVKMAYKFHDHFRDTNGISGNIHYQCDINPLPVVVKNVIFGLIVLRSRLRYSAVPHDFPQCSHNLLLQSFLEKDLDH